MSLTHRPMQTADLKRCFSILDDREAYSSTEEGNVLEFWASLLKRKVALCWVVEDHELTATRRILVFGVSVFVSDDFK